MTMYEHTLLLCVLGLASRTRHSAESSVAPSTYDWGLLSAVCVLHVCSLMDALAVQLTKTGTVEQTTESIELANSAVSG